jgi:hypothetical protein
MTKAAIIISAILVFAGVAAASSLPGLGGASNDTPTLDTPPLASTSTSTTTSTTTTNDDVRREDRRADDDDNINGEDLRGPCDEAEHANDPRCTGAQADDRRADHDRSGPNRGPEDDSGHGGDDSGGGGNSGHGGGGDDD